VVAFLSLTATASLQAAAAAVLMVAVLVADASAQATAVTVSGTNYSQNFDGITTGQTSSITSAAPGWSFFRSGTSSAPLTYTSGSNTTAVTQNAGTAGTGVVTNASSGGAYLWVSGTLASGTDKSIGYLSTGSYPGTTSSAPGQQLAILFGFTNTSGATITTLDLAWNYERYRMGTRTQGWEFYTSTDGSRGRPTRLATRRCIPEPARRLSTTRRSRPQRPSRSPASAFRTARTTTCAGAM
jgi:hypothetical protein